MISTTTNTQGAAILCEHEDGRYAVNPDTTGDPARHRLGPVDISALAASTQSGLTDAYAGAREDLSIWKRRALEAERDLRSEKQTTSRLVGELNAANGPAYMGEPAASPAYGATEYGWADYRRLQDGDKRLIALVVNLYGNDHQSSSDLEGLLDRASRWQVPAQQPEATHLRELAAPSTDQVEEILRERDDADDFIDALLDEVLGPERPEWSSAYGRADALNDVRERMTALHKPAVDKAWDRFQSAMEAPQQPAPSPVPAGWKLVPVEPTEEMLKAADDGDDAYTLRCFGPGVQRVMQGPYDHYCAMLDAAPTAQADTQPAPVLDYPPLPEPDIAVCNGGKARIFTNKDIVGEPYYTADQMRAYVDSDRAARAQADSVTAPAKESHCANCGKPASESQYRIADYPEEGEWFCSAQCKDQHDELDCPHLTHNGYRHPAESERLIACERALRSLAAWLSVGGFNAPTVDAKIFEEKIRWGIEHLLQATPPAKAADSVLEDAARLDWLIEQRAYIVSDPDACPGYWLHWARPDGSTWVQGDEHPTSRAAIDAAMNKGGSA